MLPGQFGGVLSATLPLQTRLAGRDPIETIRSIAALQLIPRNASGHLRLEVLAHVAASLDPDDGSEELPLDEVEEICNQGPIENIFHLEDPFVNYFTEGVTLPGGEAIAFPGIVEQSAYLHTRFLESLYILRQGDLATDRVLEELDLLLAASLFSNRIARRAGLDRNELPQGSRHGGDVVVPDSPELGRLMDAVTIPKAQWSMVARALRFDPETIEKLSLPVSGVDLVNYELAEGELNTAPVIDTGDAYCAAIPSMLLPAARHRIILNLLDEGNGDAFADAFTKSVWNDLRRALSRLEHRQLAFELPEPESPPTTFREGVFQFDTDKAVYVLLITDDLSDYDPTSPFGMNPSEEIPSFVADRLNEAGDAWQAEGDAEGNLSFLLVHQGVGRSFISGFNPPDHPALDTGLLLRASDIDLLSLLEVGQPLFLWKHARALDQLRETTRLNHTDYMDVIGLYRERNNSFYLADEEKPDLLHVPPGQKWSLIEELWECHNPHWAPDWDRSRSQRVVNRYDKREVPIYFPLEGPTSRAPHLVEGLPRFVWVLGARPIDSDETRILSGLADAVAFWIWQATPYLGPLDGWEDFPHATLNVEVDIEDPEAWTAWMGGQSETAEQPDDGTAPTIEFDRDAGTVYVGFTEGLRRELERPDNEGERTLLKHLLPAFRSLINGDAEPWDDDRIEEIVDAIAPPGLKKKILLLDVQSSPMLRGGNLPSWRPVQDADKERLLDELGVFLEEQGFDEGPIPEDDRQDALNDVVGWLYGRLQDRCAELSPDGPMEFVLAHHEALVNARAEHELLLPTRRACFGASPDMQEAMKEEHMEFANAGIATRFLVEYLAAQPPSGDEPLSLATYDELIALCSLIADLGFESDFMEFGIVEHELHVLPSGRIGRPERPIEEAIHGFADLFVPYEVERHADRFPDYWAEHEETGPKPEFIEKFDRGAEDEFGVSITDQLILMVEAVNLASDAGSEPAILPRETLIGRLEEETELSRQTVEQGLDILSLEARDDFLTPPGPFEQREVYPWVFNRQLSFIRRPFILRETGDHVEVLWGQRHTWACLQNLQALCSTGRLPCDSEDLRELIGEMNHRRGKDYNAFIGKTVQKATDAEVKVNWDAQGRLAVDGGPLGDIDVLVPDLEQATLYAIECKRLALARTPREIDRELEQLFGSTSLEEDEEATPGAVDKHTQRIEWMRNNTDEVIEMLGLDPDRDWSVEPVLLLDKPLISIFIGESPIPVLVEGQLEEAPVQALRNAVARH